MWDCRRNGAYGGGRKEEGIREEMEELKWEGVSKKERMGEWINLN